jgi:hypothetical protein
MSLHNQLIPQEEMVVEEEEDSELYTDFKKGYFLWPDFNGLGQLCYLPFFENVN